MGEIQNTDEKNTVVAGGIDLKDVTKSVDLDSNVESAALTILKCIIIGSQTGAWIGVTYGIFLVIVTPGHLKYPVYVLFVVMGTGILGMVAGSIFLTPLVYIIIAIRKNK